MFCSILCKTASSSSSTLATIKSFNHIGRPLKLILQNKFVVKEYSCLHSFKPSGIIFYSSFSSRWQYKLLSSSSSSSKETQESSSVVVDDPLINTSERTEECDETSSSLFSNIDYDTITDNDPELTKKLKIILAEVYVLYEEGKEIPTKLSKEQYKELLHLRSRTARLQFLRYLYVSERRKKGEELKKLAKREERQKFLMEKAAKEAEEQPITTKSSNDDDRLAYGLSDNCLLLRIYDTSMDRYHNYSAHQASMFGPKLIIDCGYSQIMTTRENKLTAKQLMVGFGENRKHNFPLHLVFCNFNKEDLTSKELVKYMPTMYEPHFPIDLHPQSYLDLFPKERLVYLTPHCHEEFHTVKGDDIFIVGGMVDIVNHQKASLGKAKKEGIRMAKFPIDLHLNWGTGIKNLTINQSIMIMTDMYWRHDWQYAFNRWIPKRKLMSKDHVSYATKMLKQLNRDDDDAAAAMNFNPKFRQKNNYNAQQHYNRNNFSMFNKRRHSRFNAQEFFDNSADEEHSGGKFRGRLPPRGSK